MESNKPLASAGYVLGTLFVVLPLFDVVASVWPLHLGDERWRFGVIGQLSNVTLVPLLGFLILLSIASMRDQRTVRRLVGAITGAFALILAALTVLFVLDYFQTLTTVRPQFRQPVTAATIAALVKHVLTIITLALLSRAGFAGPRAVARRTAAPIDRDAAALIPLGGTARAE